MALFAAGGVAQGVGEVDWAMGLLWGREVTIMVSKMGEHMAKKQKSKINATNYQMKRVDESFEVCCVVKQEDGRLWSYGEGYDAAMENPIAAWFLER